MRFAQTHISGQSRGRTTRHTRHNAITRQCAKLDTSTRIASKNLTKLQVFGTTSQTDILRRHNMNKRRTCDITIKPVLRNKLSGTKTLKVVSWSTFQSDILWKTYKTVQNFGILCVGVCVCVAGGKVLCTVVKIRQKQQKTARKSRTWVMAAKI